MITAKLEIFLQTSFIFFFFVLHCFLESDISTGGSSTTAEGGQQGCQPADSCSMAGCYWVIKTRPLLKVIHDQDQFTYYPQHGMSLCNITLHTHTQPSHIPNPVRQPAFYSSLWRGSGDYSRPTSISTLVPSPSQALLSPLLLHISSLPALPPITSCSLSLPCT